MKLNVKDFLRFKSDVPILRLKKALLGRTKIEHRDGRTTETKYNYMIAIGDLIGTGYTSTPKIEIEVVDPLEPNPTPVPMLLTCPIPLCGARHIDTGAFATKVHHTHSCQQCGHTWRPAVVPTVGVQFLPGFKSEV